jgi:hypothetical protein
VIDSRREEIVANISIERKKRSGATPWIVVGIALVALLAWLLFFRASERVATQRSEGVVIDSAVQVDTAGRSR